MFETLATKTGTSTGCCFWGLDVLLQRRQSLSVIANPGVGSLTWHVLWCATIPDFFYNMRTIPFGIGCLLLPIALTAGSLAVSGPEPRADRPEPSSIATMEAAAAPSAVFHEPKPGGDSLSEDAHPAWRRVLSFRPNLWRANMQFSNGLVYEQGGFSASAMEPGAIGSAAQAGAGCPSCN